jgi:drug/metabolite transporter (DMT)-like permease
MGLLLYVFGQRLQVYGNNLGTATNSSVLMALDPLVTSVGAALFLHEHLGPRRMAGFALGLCGVAILNRIWRPDFHWTGLAGSLIFVSSFVLEAAYSIIAKPIIARASLMKMLALSLLVGTAVNLVIDGPQTVAMARDLSLKTWLLLLYLAVVCTAVGYGVWFVVIRECPVNLAGLTIFAQSVFGAAIAALWLHEQLHWGHFFGSLTIIAGLALGLSRQIKKTAPPEQPPIQEG